MNWLKKGPELKLSGVKVPDFFFDLYYDLKDRRLLPLVALLLVAIVAVPILLAQAGSSSDEAGEEAVAPIAGSSSASPGALVVARSAPGLRDYRRRLEHSPAVDPFEQQFEGGAGEGAGASSETAPSGGESSATVEESSIEFEPTGAAPVMPEGESTGGDTPAKYATNSIDVRIVSVPRSGDAGANPQAKPQVRRDLPELTMLPSREVPAAVFMGISADGKKALLMVSSDVQSIFGDGQCIVGSKTCQLLALEEGLPQTFVYGPQGRTYRIEIIKIEKTLSKNPRRAALGSPKQGKRQGQKPDGGKPKDEAPAGPGWGAQPR
jgi:hypothetical protein